MPRFIRFLSQSAPFRSALLSLLGLALGETLRPGMARADVIVRFDESGGMLRATVDSPPDAQVQGVNNDPIIRQIRQEAIGVSGEVDIGFQFSSTGTIQAETLTTVYRIFDVLPDPKTPKDPGDPQPKDPKDPQPKEPKEGILSDWLKITLTPLQGPNGGPNFEADLTFLSAAPDGTLTLPAIPKGAIVIDLLETNAPTTVDSGLADLIVSFTSEIHAAAVPEPSTFVMSSILFGMFGVVWSYKRRGTHDRTNVC